MNDLDSLLARYFAGELSDDEAATLLSFCREDVTARQKLVEMTHTHRTLLWLHHDADEDRFAEEVMMRVEPDTVESAAFVAGVIAKVQPSGTRSRAFGVWQKVLALAAIIALAAGAAFYLTSVRIREDARDLQSSAAPSGPHVAVITGLWGEGESDLAIGKALTAGDIRLPSGRMNISFADGAQLVVEGPSQLSLLSPSRARLLGGKATAHVPEAARGFTIETPGVEVVDLGTEFGVAVDESGVSDVHVFRGEVEARIAGDDADSGELVALNTAEGRRFARNGATVTARPDPQIFPPPPSPSPDAPQTQGAIHYLHQPPVSVETGRLESNEFILLFKEREAIELTRDTAVSFAHPGRYSGSQKLRAKIGPTRQVSSYLLHYDPITRPSDRTPLRREGSVTFSTPIVGVINKPAMLNQTDSVFGHPAASYDHDKRRGVERKNSGASNDVIVMSRDRRTLHFNLAVSGDLDQVRILVRSSQAENAQKSVSEAQVQTVSQ